MNDSLRDPKKAIDEGFRAFTRAHGDALEGFFSPLQHFLIAAERFMTQTPWPIKQVGPRSVQMPGSGVPARQVRLDVGARMRSMWK